MPDLPAPVFVDPTGRRRRTIRGASIIGAFALLSISGLIIAALLGAPLGQLNPLPEPASGPPAAVEPVPVPQPVDTPVATTTTTAEPGRVVAPATTTTTTPTAPAATTTTTTTKGNKPATPPGRPTDLPTPPSRTR